MAQRRSALAHVPAEHWPLTAATIDVAAAWNGAAQYRWSIGILLDGIAWRAQSRRQ